MTNILFISVINKRFLRGCAPNDFVCDLLLIFVKHKDQPELGHCCSFEIEAVNFRLIKRLFMRPDGLTEFFKPGQGNEAAALKMVASHIEILNVSVDSFGLVLF